MKAYKLIKSKNYQMEHKNYLLFLAICFFLNSCKTKTETITPEIKNITESVYASGIIKSKNQYEVFSQLNGILKKIYFSEGRHVKIGDPLFQIENKNSKYAIDNARLTAAANDYDLNAESIKDAQNTIQFAKKKLLNDSLLNVRQRNLWDKNIGARIDAEQKELNFENSKLALVHAMANYEELKRKLKLASGQSKNNLKVARSNDDDLIIRSEVNGIVYKINKEQGEMVNSLSALAVIGENDFIIELDVDEFDILKLKAGQQVLVRMDSYKSQVFEAKVLSIYPMMNERTRTFKVEASFTKKPDLLFPNLTLEANIVINTKKEALTIPRNYLIKDSFVILENGAMQKIKIGLMDYKLIEIQSGLTPNSKIILPKK